MTVALDGLRVVELASGITGPYAGKLLVDLGAEVVKIEPPQGDSLRRWGPFPDNAVDLERSGLFEYLNAGKRGLTLDLAREDDRAEAQRLVATAHLLIECNSGIAELEHPGLVVARISNFGRHGPMRNRDATPLTMQAAGGWITNRDPGRPPVQAGARISEYVAGAYAALGALTALRYRSESSTEPIEVDVSVMEALLSTLPYPMLAVQKMRKMGMMPTGRGGPMLGVVRVSDGWVGINCLTGQHWLDVCAMVGLPEFGEHQVAVMHGAPERAEFFDKAQQWLDEQTVTGIVELSQAMRIPAAPVCDGASALTCPQYVARSSFLDAGGDGWSFRRPGAPYRLSKTPVSVPRPAPRLGSSGPLEFSCPATDPGAGMVPSAPFDGLTVLDLSTFWAGAYLTCYLGAFGADVIKVESIQRPDGFRYSGAFPAEGDDWYERSVMWQGTNLNKRDVTLNLTTEAGRELVRELVARADVVVENFSPRVVEHFGLDYDSVAAIKPDVIMVRMPGFGLEGPWRDYVGWALNIEQMSGMSAATGYPDGPPTDLQGPADPIVGVHASVALLAALDHRRRTGEGQLIEVAQIEVGAAVVAEPVIAYSMNGEVPPRVGNRHRGYLQGVYPTADQAWVALSVRDDADWAQLVDAIADPELLGTPPPSSREAFDGVVSAWTGTRSAAELVDALSVRHVPVERLMTPDRMYDVEQLEARGYYEVLEHPLSGRLRFPGWPFRMTPGPPHHHRWAAPTLGRDNDVVLSELGVPDEQIATLREQFVIGDRALGT
ncbi:MULTISPECIES: CoA transferase [unclassified Mycobacterium]|uniref:CaiB/BaiF CoA-transferase family protein n=1 Tax=unclassified Mycobacterium TaxID=2642494 RepID=UPI0029C74908|nr:MULTISPECIES: CoA transferase [unclassified Mycobacterium]